MAVVPTILSPRRSLRAIIACSSTLAVYTRTYTAAAPFHQLFERLSDEFLDTADEPTGHDPAYLYRLRLLLKDIALGDPAEIPG